MSQLEQKRRERATAGSRRKRDREAAGLRVVGKHEQEQAELKEREDRLRPRVAGSPETDSAWSDVVAELTAVVSESMYALWLGPLNCLGEVDGALVLEAPEGIFAWTNRRYGKLIGDVVRGATDYRGAFLFQRQSEKDEGIL